MFDYLMLLQMELVLVFTLTIQIQSVQLDKFILFLQMAARPWYKPERTALGYDKDKFLVFIGWAV